MDNKGSNDTIIENDYTYNINETPKTNNSNNLINSIMTIINFIKKLFKKK